MRRGFWVSVSRDLTFEVRGEIEPNLFGKDLRITSIRPYRNPINGRPLPMNKYQLPFVIYGHFVSSKEGVLYVEGTNLKIGRVLEVRNSSVEEVIWFRDKCLRLLTIPHNIR